MQSKLIRTSADQVGAIICALALFSTRPTAFGELYSLPGMLMALLGAGIMAISAIAEGGKAFDLSSNQPWIFVAFALYLATIVILGGRPNNSELYFKAVFVILIGSAIGFVILADRMRAQYFFDTIAIIIIVLAVSTLITIALILGGANLQTLRLGSLSYTYPAPAGTILFPFSMLYNYSPTWFGILPRLSGGFREVGIFPAFVCWAAGYAASRKWSPIIIGTCLVSSVACLSSLGAIAALTTLLGIVGYRVRAPMWVYLLAMPISLLAIFISTYNLKYIGIGYKYVYVNQSYAERMYATTSITGEELIFGGEPEDRNAGINLISSIRIYGLVGVGLLSVGLGVALKSWRFFIAALAVPLFIALTSQPIAQEPLFFLLFLSWRFSDDREMPR